MLGNLFAVCHSYGDFGRALHTGIPPGTISSDNFLQRVVCWIPDELYSVARIAPDQHSGTLYC